MIEEGYVSKYYRHYYPNNTDTRASTEISYTKYRKQDDQIFTNRYNAGFDLSGIAEIVVSGPEIRMQKLIDIRRLDTMEIEIINALRENWEVSNIDPYLIRYVVNDKAYTYTQTQREVYDTLIDGAAGKVIVSEGVYREEETEEIVNEFTSKDIFVTDIGLYASMSEFENYRMELELIEQMPIEEFERRADHDKHRIAWIDPEKAFDENNEFSICGHERFIADYYNSTPDGRYVNGKRAMLDTIYSNLDESKMLEQNGMLTFRFVVNCEGKAGRFIAEGFDFMYEPIKFEDETINHLYGILQKLDDWRPVVIRDEARDAYFYITFKIEDGKITDILP